MADIFLTNTLTRKKEKFEPIEKGKVRFYTCGPTVYRDVHIGNLRTYISADILRRSLTYNGYEVTFVKNITDVGHMRIDEATQEGHDPIITEALKKGKTPLDIAHEYTKQFIIDENKLNILPADKIPKATEYIEQMTELIKILLQKGFAYEVEGNIYFDVKKFTNYGQLSGNTLEKMDQLLEAVRVSSETDKKDSIDFALWKKADAGHIMKWQSPWGAGFPGWHIECSAMSMDLLGESLDIHAGGEDLIFPHHENEIAQSEAATGKRFVTIWSHSGWLLIDGKKMSRREGNVYTLKTIIDKGFHPLALRYLVLTAHYKSRLNFTWESLEAAQTALNNLYREISSFGKPAEKGNSEYEQKFLEAINDDLDTPRALAILNQVLTSNFPDDEKAKTLLKFDEVLGLDFSSSLLAESQTVEVQELLVEREKARGAKDFARADEVRKKISDLGFEVVDTPQGAKIKRIIQ